MTSQPSHGSRAEQKRSIIVSAEALDH